VELRFDWDAVMLKSPATSFSCLLCTTYPSINSEILIGLSFSKVRFSFVIDYALFVSWPYSPARVRKAGEGFIDWRNWVNYNEHCIYRDILFGLLALPLPSTVRIFCSRSVILFLPKIGKKLFYLYYFCTVFKPEAERDDFRSYSLFLVGWGDFTLGLLLRSV